MNVGSLIVFSVLTAMLMTTVTRTNVSAELKAGNAAHQNDGVVRPSSLAGVLEAYLPSLFPSSHGANLLLLNNGDLLCFWFSGEWEGDSDVGILVSRLGKGSKRWSRPVLVDHELGKSYQNPVGFQAPNGLIWLLHTTQDAGQGQANANVLLVLSKDNGKTWSKPKPLFTRAGSFVRQPLVLLGDNGWLLPMYYTPSKGIISGAETNYSITMISSDSGKTWKECPIPGTAGMVHPNVIKFSDTSFVAFYRSRFADWIYRSTSRDGCTWTAPTPTQLPNNNSSIQATLLRNGHLVMAFNNSCAVTGSGRAQAALRKPLSVAVSEDGGAKWPWVRDIEVGDVSIRGEVGDPLDKKEHVKGSAAYDEYSYPTILQGLDGMISVAYTYCREGIKYVTFSEEWIKQGSTVGRFKGDLPR